MEIITLTNSNNESLVLNNKAPFILQSLDGVGGASSKIQTQKAPYQDGNTYINSYLEPRSIDIDLGIYASNQKKLYDLRAKVCNILNSKLGKGKLTYKNDRGTKTIDYVIDVPPTFPSGNKNRMIGYQKCTFSLLCNSPFWEDDVHNSIKLADVVPLFHFPLEIKTEGIEFSDISDGYYDIVNKGNVSTPIEIIFNGAVTNPIITNTTTNEFIKVNTTVGEKESLIINTAFGNKKVILIDSDGNKINKFGHIDLNSTFFNLQTGTNKITYDADTGADLATVKISYKQRYIGI
jgi:hypothetical protein